MTDKYYIYHLMELYYPYISYGGVLLYLFLARRQKCPGEWIEVTVEEFEASIELTAESIRKYEMLCGLMGLLEVEREYCPNDVLEEGVPRKKRYRVYKPMTAAKFKNHLKVLDLPNIDKIKNLRPERNKKQLKMLDRKINEFCVGKKPGIQSKLDLKWFDKKDEVDEFNTDRLFNTYDFLSDKIKILYIYLLYKYKRSLFGPGIHIPRKEMKKNLNFGDEQIRRGMYLLCAVGLINVQKTKYYLLFINTPVTREYLGESVRKEMLPIPWQKLEFMTPKYVNDKNRYYDEYNHIIDKLEELKSRQ